MHAYIYNIGYKNTNMIEKDTHTHLYKYKHDRKRHTQLYKYTNEYVDKQYIQ